MRCLTTPQASHAVWCHGSHTIGAQRGPGGPEMFGAAFRILVLYSCHAAFAERHSVAAQQEGMEMGDQGRGLCISFSWLVNDRTLVGARSTRSYAVHVLFASSPG
jgi:hypothetical protein